MTTKEKLLIGSLWVSSLVIASAGAGVASTLITGKQIKDGSITGRDIKNRSIERIDLAQNAWLPGPRGPRGPAGAGGTGGVEGLQLVTKTQPPPASYTIASSIIARCPAGKKVIGGGFGGTGGGAFSSIIYVSQNHPDAHLRQWVVVTTGGGAFPGQPGSGISSTAYAICAKA